MIVLDITSFVGRFHPLIVHLPIGIFILAFLFDIISYNKRFLHFRQVVPIIILTGFIFSILSVVLGFLLANDGEYDRKTLSSHRNGGILLTLLTGVLYVLSVQKLKPISPWVYTSFISVMIVFLIYTGHQGANLTHGSDYINLSLLNQHKREKPGSVNEVLLYEDVVQPILLRKCAQCHRQGKKKGRLSVETIADMKKGGKSGAGIVEGNAAESEIIQRVSLDPSHEDFMPADGKTPLTKNEIAILKWWIEKGITIGEKRLVQHQNAGEITGAVNAFLQLSNENVEADVEGYEGVPDTVDMQAIERLRKKGFNVRIMLKRPVLLDVSLSSGSRERFVSAINELNAVSKNIIWLNISNNQLTNEDVRLISSMKNIEKLRLEKNNISDNICEVLKDLTKLEAVNLNDTKVSKQCIDALTKQPSIKHIYSYPSPQKN
jgi:uncharacterized membrane protein/uncharacterized protein (UPF0335 family)